MKLKIWVGWIARSVAFNLWTNSIILDEMNWPWKMNNVTYAGLPDLLILSSCFSLLVLVSNSIQFTVRMVNLHTHKQFWRAYSLSTWGQRSQDHCQSYTGLWLGWYFAHFYLIWSLPGINALINIYTLHRLKTGMGVLKQGSSEVSVSTVTGKRLISQ